MKALSTAVRVKKVVWPNFCMIAGGEWMNSDADLRVTVAAPNSLPDTQLAVKLSPNPFFDHLPFLLFPFFSTAFCLCQC